jgi:hypothetical protein
MLRQFGLHSHVIQMSLAPSTLDMYAIIGEAVEKLQPHERELILARISSSDAAVMVDKLALLWVQHPTMELHVLLKQML